jgi:uncharacterized protein with HEPN domain
MLVEAEVLVQQTRSVTKDGMLDDEVLRRAVVRSIEVIGEAAKGVPIEFRTRYPQVDWKLMAGKRDRLIHGYFGIDYDIVWDVATQEASILKAQLEHILAAEDKTAT